MSIVTEIATAGVKKSLTPWFVAAAVLALATTGTAGMYAGAMIERGRHADEITALKDEQLRSMALATQLWQQAQSRSNEVSTRFEAALREIKIENKTFVQEVQRETEKLVYTDCRLPDSGVDLLKKQVDAANMRLLGREKRK